MYGFEKPVTCCEECECDLYEGEDVYVVDGVLYCEDCFEEFVRENFKKTVAKRIEFGEECYE